MRDELGDRMKELERASAGAPIPPGHAVYVRIDGRGFSRFTRGMARPFDPRMTAAMRAVAEHLLSAVQARAAYVQSDEISLLWAPAMKTAEDGAVIPTEHFFGGKPQKIASVLAGLATGAFTRALLADPDGLSAWVDRLPHFDARVVAMPTLRDGLDAIAWRGIDARRNAIRQLAGAHFSHRRLMGRGNREVVAMLSEEGIRISDQPPASMNGTLLYRARVRRPLSAQERTRIPERNRPAEGTQVERHETRAVSFAHPGRIANLAEVILDAAAPVQDGVPFPA